MNNISEQGKGKDEISIVRKKAMIERVFEHAVWKIRRWKSKADKRAGKIYSKKEALKLFGVPQFTKIEGNELVNEGINEMWKLICGTGGVQFSNALANLIVGTGSGAAAAGDTEATFTAGVKKTMEAGYPTYGTSQKAIWRSSYGASDANQAWAEFGVLNAASSGKLLNRKVSDQGTKTVGQTWQLNLTITLS